MPADPSYPADPRTNRMFPVAFPYRRFSSPSQEDGDSIRRQNALSVAWSERSGVPLDLALTLEDRGVSGFHGVSRSDPDRYALAAFLHAIEVGRVQQGDYLLIENLDRLSREEEVPATHLLTSILMKGVKVVQLSPYEMELTAKSDGWAIMRAVMELARGHGESRIKSERVRQAKTQRRKAAVAGETYLTGRLPLWLRVGSNGAVEVIPERAATVQLIYQLAREGHGTAWITRKLNEEGVAPFGKRAVLIGADGEQQKSRTGRQRWQGCEGDGYGSGRWNRGYVGKILRERLAVGELRSKGEIIRLPAVVSEEEWTQARIGARARLRRGGRVRQEHVNLFAHLLREARSGSTYFEQKRGCGKDPGSRLLKVTGSSDGANRGGSFPAEVLEDGILDQLEEIDPGEILGESARPSPVRKLQGELEEVRRQRTELEAELVGLKAAPKAAVRALGQLEEQERQLEEQLRQARQEADHPLSETWIQAQGLIPLIVRDPKARLRLRSLLRRIVEEIRMVVSGRGPGGPRAAAVQIWFTGGGHRDYLILYRPRWRDRPGKAHSGTLCDAEFDLRVREHAERVYRQLEQLDLGKMVAMDKTELPKCLPSGEDESTDEQ